MNVSAESFGYLAPRELEYLSKRLYPAECSYLTSALWNSSVGTDCNKKKISTDDSLLDRPELHCLFKLQQWNEVALKDDKAFQNLEKILHEIGRFDLAAHLLKNCSYQ